IAGTQLTEPFGCVVPPTNGCIPTGGGYDSFYNTCSCPKNTNLVGGACVAGAPSGVISNQLLASPSRVRKGQNTTLTWATSNMSSCQVSSVPGNTVLSTAL